MRRPPSTKRGEARGTVERKSGPTRTMVMPAPRVTIAHVAAEAGVSSMTVSNVINARPGASDSTRQPTTGDRRHSPARSSSSAPRPHPRASNPLWTAPTRAPVAGCGLSRIIASNLAEHMVRIGRHWLLQTSCPGPRHLRAVCSRGHRSGRRLAGLAEFPGLHCQPRGTSPTGVRVWLRFDRCSDQIVVLRSPLVGCQVPRSDVWNEGSRCRSGSWCSGGPDDTPTNSLINKRRGRGDACAARSRRRHRGSPEFRSSTGSWDCRQTRRAGWVGPPRGDERVMH
jgi:hypothetical protein